MGTDDENGDSAGRDGDRVVDARGAQGVVVGDGNTQIIYNYRRTWSDDVAPAPLIDVRGDVESPYRGLGRFTERDAPFFFGRDIAIDAVLQRLTHLISRPGLLIVSGVSGAGKSSLLRAGVIPRIRGTGLPGAPEARDRPCLVVTPGHAPLDELAVATARMAGLDAATVRRELRADPTSFALIASQAATAVGPRSQPGEHGGVLLVVDQFEQVFTQCTDGAQRRAVVTALHAAATTRLGAGERPSAAVVLVVRADFEARCAEFEQLIDAVQDRYLVTAMSERQLRLAITEPAKKAGSRVDDDLTGQLISEMLYSTTDSDSPTTTSRAGVLPLLSYALDRAWRTRAGDTLTAADYERAGGIERAVAESAQRVYDSLTPPQRTIARRIFIRLAVTGEGGDTADRVARSDLTPGDPAGDVDAVLEAFAAERLLILGADTVEVSHEIVFTAWPLLRDTWLAETHDSRVVCTRMRTAAAEWDRHGRDPAYLYSGSVLDTAATTVDAITAEPSRYPRLGDTETEFLAAALGARRRRARQRRALRGLLLVLVVALTAATVVAFRASAASARQRDIAVARDLISRSDLLAATDPAGSRFSALAAWRIDPGPESRYAVLTAARNPLIAILRGHDGALASSRDGRTLAFSTADDGVQLWDKVTRHPIGDPLPAPGGARAIAFSPDGATLTIAGGHGNARLWNTSTRLPHGDPLRDGGASTLAISTDGSTLATRDDDNAVRLWNLATRQQTGDTIVPGRGVNRGTFSPDGKTFATNDANTVQLWETATGRPAGADLPVPARALISLAFSHDGATLATVDDEATRLWETATGRELGTLPDSAGVVTNVVFGPDGSVVATGAADGLVRLWDTATLQPVGDPLTGHTGAIRSLTFGSGIIASAQGDGTVRVWDPIVRQPVRGMVIDDGSATTTAALGRNGAILATRGDDDRVRLWNTATGDQIGEPLTPPGKFTSLAFSPDGATLAAAAEDGPLRTWDLRTRRQAETPIPNDPGTIRSVAYSPDGSTLATGSFDGTVGLWDTSTHSRRGDSWTPTGGANSIIFGRDGETLLTLGLVGRTIRTWDIGSHQQTGDALAAADTVNYMALSPDGDTLAVTTIADTVQLWDMTTRRAIDAPARAADNGSAIPMAAVAFGPEGKSLLTFDPERLMKIWDTESTADPVATLCSWADGSFTEDQWKLRVPGVTYKDPCP
ncbi:nSTAND1 domain-containing NTPase [Nocardia thraciensis]